MGRVESVESDGELGILPVSVPFAALIESSLFSPSQDSDRRESRFFALLPHDGAAEEEERRREGGKKSCTPFLNVRRVYNIQLQCLTSLHIDNLVLCFLLLSNYHGV